MGTISVCWGFYSWQARAWPFSVYSSYSERSGCLIKIDCTLEVLGNEGGGGAARSEALTTSGLIREGSRHQGFMSRRHHFHLQSPALPLKHSSSKRGDPCPWRVWGLMLNSLLGAQDVSKVSASPETLRPALSSVSASLSTGFS